MDIRWILAAFCVLFPVSSVFATELPAAIDVPNVTAIATYHAEGVQIYECGLDAGRKMWRLREPIASLIDEGDCRASIRGTDMGAQGRQFGAGQSGRQRARRDAG